jgi:exosortase
MTEKQMKYKENTNLDAAYWRRQWALSCSIFIIAVIFIVFIFLNDIGSAVYQWIYNSSYGYCLLIIPLAIQIVWTNRSRLRDLGPEPSPWGAVITAFFGAVWGAAYIAGIAEAGQFAVVGIIQGLLFTVFGGRVYRRLWLPFTLLWLLVPSGEFLIPSLQSATAVGSTFLLELSGIPTYREGLTIMVPSGAYLVAPGCSGLSFLLTALVVSLTFADMFFGGRGKKIAFVSAMLMVAVAANTLRVFLIIAVAHATDNIADIADDHLLYGWVFFSVVLLGALALGHRFRDRFPARPPGGPRITGPHVPLSRSVWSLVPALTAAAVAPLAISIGLSEAGSASAPAPALSCGAFPPGARKPVWRTPSDLPNVDSVAAVDCNVGGSTFHLALAVLERPARRGKLPGLERRMINRDNWTRLQITRSIILLDGRPAPLQTERIGRGDTRRLVWTLFWADGDWRSPGMDALWADIKSDLAGRRRTVAVVIASDDIADDDDPAPDPAALLRDFLAGAPLPPFFRNISGTVN